jgi:DNA-directed RNA polymerase specialized sigma24 family protein
VSGRAYGEAGRLLGVREATITTRLYRARQRIADTLTGMDRLAAASRRPMK